MNNTTKVAIMVMGILLPAGVALAESTGQSRGRDGLGVSQQLDVNLDVNSRGNSDKVKGQEQVDVTAEQSQQQGQDTERATSSEERRHGDAVGTTSEDNGDIQKAEGPRGVPFFLRWLFGLPATTTIGEIRAQVNASTTASTSVEEAPFGDFFGLGQFFRGLRDMFRVNQ